ncbi:peptidoglycan editing factor PgeF [Polaromonas sp.]|uniref:peptidoglycan editing factor PgeF n=1 Tax=Polaromonas sp. TaxID=1869339 RepID=UPI0013BD28F7|nr:peptidoglycan editing factor PgeF [Polaromonas sp.]NDP63429.1 peptidoglycan editing factor PgeF [Polaromonas sp.]
MSGRFHSDWLVPDWPAPAGIKAVFTSRAGGVSAVPFDTMNLGSHVGDLPASVNANRQLLKRATGAERAVFLDQVHGARVELLDPDTPDGQSADACMTLHRQLACTVMVADCLPVLLASLDGTRVAAAHAGWRGLAGSGDAAGQGVIESVFESLSALAQYQHAQAATKIIAWLGPCIGPAAFEVGQEVRAAFAARQTQAAHCFTAIGPGKYLADLPALARLRLQALGVTQVYGNDGSAPWCTVGNPSRFFSHRRDTGITGNGFGTTGRMAACIWLDG